MVKFINYCTISGSSVWDLPYGLDEKHPDCIALKVAITEKISSLCQMGVTDFMCNANLGVPLWAAEAMVGMWKSFASPAIRMDIWASICRGRMRRSSAMPCTELRIAFKTDERRSHAPICTSINTSARSIGCWR